MRAPVIIIIVIRNTRCLDLVFLERWPFLARMDIGASQHLKIIRGVDIVSVAREIDKVCQEVFS